VHADLLPAVDDHREVAAGLGDEVEHRPEHRDDREARQDVRAAPLVEVVQS
jgi:hypothetical protein